MPGLKWATKSEVAFLTTKLDSFSTIHADGKARVKNPKKVSFLKEIYNEFNKRYPGRISNMDLPRVGVGGSEAERKEVMLEVSIALGHLSCVKMRQSCRLHTGIGF